MVNLPEEVQKIVCIFIVIRISIVLTLDNTSIKSIYKKKIKGLDFFSIYHFVNNFREDNLNQISIEIFNLKYHFDIV